MSAQDVIDINNAVRQADIAMWLDGGWGVDALIARQTRDHVDLDCVIALSATQSVLAALTPLGFRVLRDELPTRFVVHDTEGRCIDFHTVVFNREGDGVQTLHDGTPWRYPACGFLGAGQIADFPDRCLTAEVQALAHLGYEPDVKDVHDMALLSTRFDIELPPHVGSRR